MSFTQAIAPADFPTKQVRLAVEASGHRVDYSKISSGSVAYSDSPHLGLPPVVFRAGRAVAQRHLEQQAQRIARFANAVNKIAQRGAALVDGIAKHLANSLHQPGVALKANFIRRP